MLKVFTVAEMVAAEKAADASGATSYAQMMETAGKAVADAVIARYPVEGAHVLVLVGPGNNGGDGLVAGRYLAEAGADVAFYLYKARDPQTDENYAKIQAMGLFAVDAGFDQRYRVLHTRLNITDILIDALLGTGVTRPIGGELAKLMQQTANGLAARRAELTAVTHLTTVNRFGSEETPRPGDNQPVTIAVDCPSGLNCDTGALDELALSADLTVTFAGPKRGHFMFPGAAVCGELVAADIAIAPNLPEVAGVAVTVMTREDAREMLPARPLAGHKGTFGTALIAAGSYRYWGAPVLAARAAYRVGAGLVALAVPQAIRATIAGQIPEATYPVVPDRDVFGGESVPVLLATRSSAWLVGPGLDNAEAFMAALLAEKDTLPPLLVDADGLNILASMTNWPERLPPHTVLTPHPGEMSRLMDMPLSELKELDRVEVAREKAQAWGHVVLLKGAYSVVAAPDGRVTLIPFANPALAVGGSGDVLSGVIVGLLAQGMEPYAAACLGAYLHGAAAELYPAASGLLMSELTDWLPKVMASLR
ncbi:MAG: NAD(P)H-hydrate dehydratase [Ardenticatenaceae bacterium]|mgnify:CR=1 FL=1|nr:NAD(P)H-hydrate dehydratase [Ardenticatenaceae bacterium]